MIPRSARRAAAVLSVAGVTVAILTAPGARASTGAVPATGSSITQLATTTTTAPPPPSTTSTTTSTTTPPTTTGTPTTTRPPATTTTTTTLHSPVTGVPAVPVGGPRTTKPRPGAKPTPPPNPTAILAAVHGDLSQLSAIHEYAQARAAVATSQQGVTLAAAVLQSAAAAQSRARSAEHAAQAHVDQAATRLRFLAVAAYMGLGYLSPAAVPQGAGPAGTGTVTSPGGLSATEAADAQEMLRLVAQRERQAVADTRGQLHQAKAVTRAAGQEVAQARAAVGSAGAALSSNQQTLALVTRAATTPGMATTLNLSNLPGNQSVTPGTTGTGGGGGASSGLTALASIPATTPATTQPVTLTTTRPVTQAATGAVDAAITGPESPTVIGPSALDGTELAKWFASTRKKANTTVPIAQLAADYQKAGQQTGVRPDLAFAQSIVETGFFSFPAGGQLTPKDNNFAGIGACDSCAHGWTFPTAQTGVGAQLELLEAYASPTPVPTPLIGPVGVGGCCPTWLTLAGKWASSPVYGISIMTVYHQMLSWVIPQRLVAAGLIAPSPPAAANGPTSAALPAKPAHA